MTKTELKDVRTPRGVALCVGLVTGLLVMSSAQAAPTELHGDPAAGKQLYQKCEACHAIEENYIGPMHRGVVGRRAGSVPDFTYSAALKASGITWDEKTLNAWLTNPSALVPGTAMVFKIDDPQDRADIIAFLKEQK